MEMSKLVKVTIWDKAEYVIEVGDGDNFQAEALERFELRNHSLAYEFLTPCQVNGKCPYESDKTCSECKREFVG